MDAIEQKRAEIEAKACTRKNCVDWNCVTIAWLLAREKRLTEALAAIEKPSGEYRHDPYERACNVIENSSRIAKEALAFNPDDKNA